MLAPFVGSVSGLLIDQRVVGGWLTLGRLPAVFVFVTGAEPPRPRSEKIARASVPFAGSVPDLLADQLRSAF